MVTIQRGWERMEPQQKVGVSANLPPHQVDTKLTSLFTRSPAKSLIGKLTTITGET